MNTLYKQRLLEEGVGEDCLVELALDKTSDSRFRNPNMLYEYVLSRTGDSGKKYYVMVDEIQLSYKVKNTDIDESLVPEEDRDMLYTTFYDVLNDLTGRPNLDVYVTGSNSKMLSKDIVTNFRDRGSEIKLAPLSFREYCHFSGLEKAEALEQYLTYGGMPSAVLEQNEPEKVKYLEGLFSNVYFKDITERYRLKDDTVLICRFSYQSSQTCEYGVDSAGQDGFRPYRQELPRLSGGCLPLQKCKEIRCQGA